METRSNSENLPLILLKVLGVFAVFEAIFCFIVALVFKVALSRMLSPYCLFFLSALMGLPFILGARRYVHRPKVRALLFANGMSIFAALIAVAMHFSGVLKWLLPGLTGGELIFGAIFTVLNSAGFGYLIALKRAPTQ
jgi:hypothetical protein